MEIINDERNGIETGEVLLDFSASWCGPCKMFAPVFEEFSASNDMNCFSVDVDSNPGLSKEFGVMSVPTIVLLKDGNEIKRHNGYMALEQLEEFVK